MCWSFFLIKLQAWIIESLLWFTHVPCFHFRNNTQKNQMLRKYVTYLVKKHLNVRSIYYNVSFLIVKSFWNLSSLLHNLPYLSLLNSFLLLVLSTFHVFLKSLCNYFFQMAPLQFSSCRILVLEKLYYVVFQSWFFPIISSICLLVQVDIFIIFFHSQATFSISRK